MTVRKITRLSLFASLSLAIYAAESAVPPLVPIPGMKLGLANIITLILLRHYSWRDALLVLLTRIALSSLLFGQALSFAYSLAGGVFSLFVMAFIIKLLQKKLLFLAGAMGGLAHNAAQLLTAFLLTSTPGVLAYLPFLILSGILTGIFTGLCAAFSGRYLLRHLAY